MRRAFATAGIGVMGLATPAASAAPASTDIGTTSVNCDYYKQMTATWRKIADNSGGKKARGASKMAKSYVAKYYVCIF